MDSVTIPVRLDWQTMMRAKLANSVRPSRLLLFVFASCSIGSVVGAQQNRSLLATSLTLMGVLIAVRVTVMGLSAAFDRGPRRRFNGTLTLRDDGLELKPHDGAAEDHPWSWVLAADLRGNDLRLQLAERGGRFWAFFSLQRLAAAGARESVVAHLRNAGKLAR